MRISSLISFVGFVLVIAGAYCPLLRPFHLFNYDLFDLNRPYGMVILLMAVVGILAIALDRRPLVKTTAYITLVLIVLLYIAAVFQVKSKFSFIPFKGIASGLARAIKFKWGWYLLFAVPLLALAGVLFERRKNLNKQPEFS